MKPDSKITINSGKTIHEIDVVYTNNKNMYLKVKDNNIYVSVPKRGIREKQIHDFVAEHIERFIKYTEKVDQVHYVNLSEQFFYLLGKKINYQSVEGFPTTKVVKKGTKYYLQCNAKLDPSNEEVIQKFVFSQLEEYIAKRIIELEETMELKTHAFKVKTKETTWGTNYLNKNLITFAGKLGYYGKSIVDYVIIHELAHDYFADHSQSFWDVVQKYCPNYKKHRKALKADQQLKEE